MLSRSAWGCKGRSPFSTKPGRGGELNKVTEVTFFATTGFQRAKPFFNKAGGRHVSDLGQDAG